MRFVFYMQVYASFISSILLFFFPNSLLYTQFALLTAVLSAGVILYNLLLQRIRTSHFVQVALFCALIAIAYCITDGFYVEKSTWYDSYRLVLFGQTIPLVLMSSIIGVFPDYHKKIKIIVPYFALIFAIVALSVTINPRVAAQNLAGDEEANLNYQNTSYLASYSASLAMYYISCFRNVKWDFIFEHRFMKVLFWLVIIVDFIVILLTGGRGGLVVFLASLLFFIYNIAGKKSVGSYFRVLIIAAVFVFIGYYSVRWVMQSNISTSGFYRFTRMLAEGDLSGRDALYERGWRVFEDNPLGHGLGGVFFILGSYSHNIFLDVLIDVGLLGFLAFFVSLFFVLKYGLSLFKRDQSEAFWFYLFINGFVMNLFSGYFLSGFPWLSAVFYFLARRAYFKKNEEAIVNEVEPV